MRTLSPMRRRRAPRIPSCRIDAEGPFRTMLSNYRLTAAAEGSAPETLRTQTQCIARFIQWAEASGIGDHAGVSPRTVQAYQRHLNQYRKRDGKPLSIGAQLVSLAALKAWFKWMVRERDLPANPAGWIRLPRLPANLPAAILGLPTIEGLLALADTGTSTGLRDRALFELLYATGLRRMELVNLALEDIDLSDGVVMVRHGKGRKDRLLPVGRRACHWIGAYLGKARPMLRTQASGAALFIDEFGRPLSSRYLGDLARRYLDAAGVRARGSCHLFRHAMATHMLDNGADIRHIQAMLGHARLETTQIYTRVAIGKLKAVHAATHPTASLNGLQPVAPNPFLQAGSAAPGAIANSAAPVENAP